MCTGNHPNGSCRRSGLHRIPSRGHVAFEVLKPAANAEVDVIGTSCQHRYGPIGYHHLQRHHGLTRQRTVPYGDVRRGSGLVDLLCQYGANHSLWNSVSAIGIICAVASWHQWKDPRASNRRAIFEDCYAFVDFVDFHASASVRL